MSVEPAAPEVRSYRIVTRCANGHEQVMRLSESTRRAAEDYAKILDGSHPIFVFSPRDDPKSALAHCVTCGALFDSVVEDEPE